MVIETETNTYSIHTARQTPIPRIQPRYPHDRLSGHRRSSQRPRIRPAGTQPAHSASSVSQVVSPLAEVSISPESSECCSATAPPRAARSAAASPLTGTGSGSGAGQTPLPLATGRLFGAIDRQRGTGDGVCCCRVLGSLDGEVLLDLRLRVQQ